MRTLAALTLHISAVSAWSGCTYPEVDWLAADQGTGISSNYKVCGLGSNVYVGGYTQGTHQIKTTATGGDSTAANTVADQTTMDMHITQISSAGVPGTVWRWTGSTSSKLYFSEMQGFNTNFLAIAAPVSPGTMTLHDSTVLTNSLTDDSDGYAVKMDVSTTAGTVSWTKQFTGARGGGCSGVTGDSSGNVYASAYTCVDGTEPGVDGYGRPTGKLGKACTYAVHKLASADAAVTWSMTIPSNSAGTNLTLSTVRTDGTSVYVMGSLTGEVVLDGNMYTSASGGADYSAVVIKMSASSGAIDFVKVYGVGSTKASAGDMDLSTDGSKLVLSGGLGSSTTPTSLSSTKTVQPPATGMGSMPSYVAMLDPADGSITWAIAMPYLRGIEVTGDNANVVVYGQLTGDTSTYDLEDAYGTKTTLRSRGSYDLFVAKMDATNGLGVWAVDGGGDGMEYFWGMGMDGNDNIFVSGYSRSKVFGFGDKTMTNMQSTTSGGDGQNKAYTIMLSSTTSTPSCVSSCDGSGATSAVHTITAGNCFIDNNCFADAAAAPYPAASCYTCSASTSQTEWTGPDTTAHCFISGVCYADGAAKPGSGRSGPSTCQTCAVATATDAWTQTPGTDLATSSRGSTSCVHGTSLVTTTTTEAMTTAMTASTMVKTVTGSADMAAAKTAYTGSILETLAKTDWTGSLDFDLAVAHFGSKTFLDDYVLSALDGTGQFSGTLDATRGEMIAAQTEAMKKGLQDQILVMAALSSVGNAAKQIVDGNWDLAYAYWYGDTPGGAPWARANKRCKNYGTCGADGVTAKANFAVMAAIADGKTAATADPPDAEAAAAAFTAFRAAALGVYYQAALRYSFKMDNDVAGGTASADHQGEGQAFWRVIEPMMASMDAGLSAYTSNFYNMLTVPTGGGRYCALHYLLNQNMISGFTSANFGTLEGTSDVLCMSGIEITGAKDGDAIWEAAEGSSLVSQILSAATMAESKTAYVGSALQTIAKADYTGGTDYDLGKEYFGSATYIDDYVLSAFDATGQFAGALAPTTRGEMISAQTEAIKKGLQDQILVLAALTTLTKQSTTDATSALESWKVFYAYWSGMYPSSAPWARANKRCKNYGTCGGSTSGANGEKAIANSNILLATIDAIAALGAGDTANFTKVGELAVKARSNALIVYWQASLRYAFKMDKDVKDDLASADHQGEGGAFWRVVAAILASLEPGPAEVVTNFYTMTTVPTGTNHYCQIKRMLHANLPAGLTAADMGTLEGTSETVCVAPPTAEAEGVKEVMAEYSLPGDLADYDDKKKAQMAASMAKYLAVDASQVTVEIKSGSVIVTYKAMVLEADSAALMAAMPDTPEEVVAALADVEGLTITAADITVVSAPITQAVTTGGGGGNTVGIIIGVVGGVLCAIGILAGANHFRKKQATKITNVNKGGSA